MRHPEVAHLLKQLQPIINADGSGGATVLQSPIPGMRDEAEVREQYEFLREHLDDEEMRHEGVRQMFTHYKRALGWVLEEEHM